MAHITHIEDKAGDVVECEYYCSDSCARQSQRYKGWNGCHELHTVEFCQACNVELYAIEDEWSSRVNRLEAIELDA